MKRNNLNILLVEDDETDGEAVIRSFKDNIRQPSFFVVPSIFKAKAFLSESTPDIVIADLYLPDGNGMELLSTDKHEALYPLVIMSGKGDEERAVEAMKGGAFDYLVKSDKSMAFIPSIVRMVLREWETLRKKNRAEKKLIKAKEEAEIANRTKSEFLTKVSHELRTPMNAILGFGQLLEMDTEETLGPQQKINVSHILKAGNHLLALINELLDLSHIESGEMSLSLENVNVQNILDDLVTSVKPLVDEKSINVVNRISMGSEYFVWADRVRLKQVLLNVIANAIKYNRIGGTISFECENNRIGRIYIKIKDTGIGITEDKIGELFKPFSRLEKETSLEEGTGIGLNIAKGLTELMGGYIEVTSVLGEGSCFTIDLPIGKTDGSPGGEY